MILLIAIQICDFFCDKRKTMVCHDEQLLFSKLEQTSSTLEHVSVILKGGVFEMDVDSGTQLFVNKNIGHGNMLGAIY